MKKKIDIRKGCWFTLKGELAIKDGIALRDIKKNERLVSYGEDYIIYDEKI